MNAVRIARALHDLADAILDQETEMPPQPTAQQLRPKRIRPPQIVVPDIEITELDQKRAEKALRDRGYFMKRGS